jgi:hypothetical protein
MILEGIELPDDVGNAAIGIGSVAGACETAKTNATLVIRTRTVSLSARAAQDAEAQKGKCRDVSHAHASNSHEQSSVSVAKTVRKRTAGADRSQILSTTPAPQSCTEPAFSPSEIGIDLRQPCRSTLCGSRRIVAAARERTALPAIKRGSQIAASGSQTARCGEGRKHLALCAANR